MNKTVLVTLFLILTATSPSMATIQDDVAVLPYEVDDIRYNVFDCSDTSAITQNELTKKGWDARILLLKRPDNFNHAMVVIYDTTNYSCVFIECTQKLVTSSLPNGYTSIEEYEDVVDAVENSGYGVYEWGFETYIEQMERKGGRP